MRTRRLTLLLLLAVSATALAAQTASRADADRMAGKLAAIAARGEVPSASAAGPLRTSFTDREVNAYFLVNGPEFLPEGVTEPRVAIGQSGRLQARATVDLDAALKPKQRSWLDPLAWLGGKVEVTASGTFRAESGRGLFALETATLGGVAIPKPVLQELVTYYSRSEANPAGFDIDRPFELPARIREVQMRPGAATVVQ